MMSQWVTHDKRPAGIILGKTLHLPDHALLCAGHRFSTGWRCFRAARIPPLPLWQMIQLFKGCSVHSPKSISVKAGLVVGSTRQRVAIGQAVSCARSRGLMCSSVKEMADMRSASRSASNLPEAFRWTSAERPRDSC